MVSVIGNNGIWALEKHPMEMLYGYSVVAELRPGTRYDEVVTALGGHGELVSTPADLRPALDRAFSAGLPTVCRRIDRPDGGLPASLQPRLTARPDQIRSHAGEFRATLGEWLTSGYTHPSKSSARSPSRCTGVTPSCTRSS